jgi:hypothetical protein
MEMGRGQRVTREKRGKWRGEASGKRLARSATRECDVQQSRRKLKN